MAKVVNLRFQRKVFERAQRQAVAAQNRISFGRSPMERDAASAEAVRASKVQDGMWLTGTGEDV